MIEKYIVSLELAKRMKELGWIKETQFYWWEALDSKRWQIKYHKPLMGKIFKAPLFAEIWKELPVNIYGKGKCRTILHKILISRLEIGEMVIYYERHPNIFTGNPVQVAGEMWCWLKENGYIKNKKCYI